MKPGKIVGISLLVIIGLIGLSWGGTALGLLHMKVFEPKRQNIQREIFENTQSYVEGKRQEAIKDYKEWLLADDPSSKKALENLAAHKFANFDHVKYLEVGPVKTWVHNCKNGISNSTSSIKVPTEEPETPF